MTRKISLEVHIACDPETQRWYVASTDIPGLWLESDTADELIRRLADAAPEMIELNEAELLERFGLQKGDTSSHGKLPFADVRPVFDSPLTACA